MTPTWTGEIHPAANLFPMISGDEFDDLTNDIKTNGLIEPLWLTVDGQLLDGRNRAAACRESGVEPRFRVYEGNDPISFVVSLNLKRRHLTAGQKAMLALEVLSAYEEQGRKIMAEAAPKAHESKKGNEGSADLHYPKEQGPRSADKAAGVVGVSGRAVAQAKRIEKHAPDLAEKVRTGELALDKAEKQVTRRLQTQDEQQAREIVMADVPSDTEGKNWKLYNGDYRERLQEIPAGSVDLIVTDPPYPAEFMHLWEDLSEQAARVLKPQGILVALTGAIYLPDVINMLGKHLSWGWLYIQPFQKTSSRIMARHVLQSHKPWVAYSNGQWPSGNVDWHADMLDIAYRTKNSYRWEQDPDPTKMLIDALCPAGGTVLDPYTGTGSFGIAAMQMGRKFIGVEMDSERFTKASERLADHG
jgi:16S rRNA G966 N2-methylase RsmD